MRARKRQRAFVEYARELGARDVKIEPTRGSHLRLKGRFAGRPFIYHFAATPSCGRADKNVRAGLRRIAREGVA